jgi:hypothetical protein
MGPTAKSHGIQVGVSCYGIRILAGGQHVDLFRMRSESISGGERGWMDVIVDSVEWEDGIVMGGI